MLRYVLVVMILAMVAAIFGFGGLGVGASGMAHLMSLCFVMLAVLGLIFGLLRGR